MDKCGVGVSCEVLVQRSQGSRISLSLSRPKNLISEVPLQTLDGTIRKSCSSRILEPGALKPGQFPVPKLSLEGVLREQKILKGHLPRVTYH